MTRRPPSAKGAKISNTEGSKLTAVFSNTLLWLDSSQLSTNQSMILTKLTWSSMNPLELPVLPDVQMRYIMSVELQGRFRLVEGYSVISCWDSSTSTTCIAYTHVSCSHVLALLQGGAELCGKLFYIINFARHHGHGCLRGVCALRYECTSHFTAYSDRTPLHCSIALRSNASPTAQCCSARKVHNRLVPLPLHL